MRKDYLYDDEQGPANSPLAKPPLLNERRGPSAASDSRATAFEPSEFDFAPGNVTRSPVSKSSRRLHRKPPADLSDPDLPSSSPAYSATDMPKQDGDFDDIINSLELEIDSYKISKSESINSTEWTGIVYPDNSSPPKNSPEPPNTRHSSSGGRSSDYNTDYSSSLHSIDRPPPEMEAPYPLDSPVVQSPVSSHVASLNEFYPVDSSKSAASIPNTFGVSENLHQLSEDYDTFHGFSNAMPPSNPFQRTDSALNTSGRGSSKPAGSGLISNTTSRVNSVSSELAKKPNHRKSSSMSSIWSLGSNRNVNLATLKKTLNLKPGEGERSTYVATIRRNAGTAYNDSGPGKWKLPIGIAPIDKNSTLNSNNGKYMRMGISQGRAKKASGVELKHGHLAPRLLAAEIDDNDDNFSFGTPKHTKSSSSSMVNTSTTSAPNSIYGKESLTRTITDTSVASGSGLWTNGEASTSSGRTKSTSSSSGSLSDENVEIEGFYQHPGYNYNDDTIENDASATEVETNDDKGSFDDDYDRPKLFLANPDSSDSD